MYFFGTLDFLFYIFIRKQRRFQVTEILTQEKKCNLATHLVFRYRRRPVHDGELHVTSRAAEEQLVAVSQQLCVLGQERQLRHPLADHVVQYDHVAVPAELGRSVQNALDVDRS